MEEENKIAGAFSSRRRVNLKKNFKGEIGFEVTVELIDSTNEKVSEEVLRLKGMIDKGTS